ncbi:MAG: acyl-CoA thioesterase [Bacteroidetes bacterium]|nr:acyl-CoA thioesterase [Bacteroidota bacterium]
MHNYPVKLPLRLDWSEMDLFGHINNVSYFKYVQAARVNYWETIGINSLKEDGIGPMLLSTSCRFQKPLFYPGNIVIESSVTYMKNTSFGISHRILNSDNELAAEAEDVIVMYDFDANEKVLISDALRNKVSELEGKTY